MPEDISGFLQDDVTYGMTVFIVTVFEVIEVNHNQGKVAFFFTAFKSSRDRFFKK